jgi:hypothetical protein
MLSSSPSAAAPGIGGYQPQRGAAVFTAAQWAELEQQALIYKYLVAGVPVPGDLLLPIRPHSSAAATYSFANPAAAPFYHHHHHPSRKLSLHLFSTNGPSLVCFMLGYSNLRKIYICVRVCFLGTFSFFFCFFFQDRISLLPCSLGLICYCSHDLLIDERTRIFAYSMSV